MVFGFVCLVGGSAGVRINTSDSVPHGLYLRSRDLAAVLVEFCPDEPFATESRARGYRAYGRGCRDHAIPLLKPIVASEGDIVSVSVDGLVVNGRRLVNTKPLSADGAGRPLKPWPAGVYRVNRGELWIASTYNLGSYDSRYMGPIKTRRIRGRLRPIWLWKQ